MIKHNFRVELDLTIASDSEKNVTKTLSKPLIILKKRMLPKP